MVTLQQYSEEIFWLQRRIKLLEMLDELLDDDVYDAEEKVAVITKQFEKVKDPADLVDRLKDIYGKKLR